MPSSASSATRTSLAIKKEETRNVAPTNTEYQYVRKVGIADCKVNIETVSSQETRNDRQKTDNIYVSKNPTIDFDFELSFGSYDDLIECALFSSFVGLPKLYNQTSYSVITQVTNSSSTFTLLSGGTSFKTGHLVKCTGFGQSSNNGVFKVLSSTETTIVVNGTLSDESSPPEGSTLIVVGFQGSEGDIDASEEGITSTSMNFTTLGLVPGMWIKIGGLGELNRFESSYNNQYARISSLSTNNINFDIFPDNWEEETGTGLSIKFWAGDYLRNGIDKSSYTLIQSYQDHTPVDHEIYTGSIINGITFSIEKNGIVTGKISMLCQDGSISTTLPSGITFKNPNKNDVYNATSNLKMVYIDDVNANVFIDKFSFEISNNLSRVDAVMYDYSIDLSEGDFMGSGTMTAFFINGSLYSKAILNEDSSFGFGLKDNKNQCYIFDLPRIKYSTFDKSVSDNTIYQDLNMVSLLNDKDYMAQIQRMFYVE